MTTQWNGPFSCGMYYRRRNFGVQNEVLERTGFIEISCAWDQLFFVQVYCVLLGPEIASIVVGGSQNTEIVLQLELKTE